MAMKVTVDEKKRTVTVEMPLAPAASASGKMILLATSRGNAATDAEYQGQQVYANVNIGVYATPKDEEKKK